MADNKKTSLFLFETMSHVAPDGLELAPQECSLLDPPALSSQVPELQLRTAMLKYSEIIVEMQLFKIHI